MYRRTAFVLVVVLLALIDPLKAQDTATLSDRQLRQRLDYALNDTRQSIEELNQVLARMQTLRTAVQNRITRDSLASRPTTGTRPSTGTGTPTGGPNTPSTSVPSTGPDAGSALVYGHDFNDGTIGSFGQWGGNTPRPVSVIADPTGSGRGKVARVDYVYDPATGGSHDANGGLYYRANPAGGHASGVGFGERIYVAGDFYLPRYPYTAPAQAQYDQRKLIYVKFGDPGNLSGHVTIKPWGRADKSGMDLAITSGSVGAGTLETVYGLAPVAFNQWHRLEMEILVNHRGAADGIMRVWLNGRLVKERTNVLLFGASPSAASDFIFEYGIGNQEQWTPSDVMKDYRLWDNVQFRTARP
ncbi:MAG TPA: hypothetical protein VGV85_11110 [Longimicrobiaceae bacterium]|nr:hypothetical protein [Longimicrobiaceae bacterium]